MNLPLPFTVNDVSVNGDTIFVAGGGGYVVIQIGDRPDHSAS